jgi:predicted ATP-grasp superfamily ATP-dependent carboligase
MQAVHIEQHGSPRRILILGGSTRAAADSVRRAGWIPVCADLFADLDLRATAEVIPVQNYPYSLPDDVSHVHADAWFYCGALENHPEIIERILVTNSSIGPLLGTSPQALKFVRNPFRLFNCLRWEGIKTLDIADRSSPPEPDGTWIQKPMASAGGRLIRVWDEAAARNPFPELCYFQERARGMAASALFQFQSGKAQWLGVSQELDAPASSCAPSPFSYCGSSTLQCDNTNLTDEPKSGVWISEAVKQCLQRIADVLSNYAKGLQGLVGFDFRVDAKNDVWLTEINPRYTASVELLELALGRSLLNPLIEKPSAEILHSDNRGNISKLPATVLIKQVLYAASPFAAPDLSRFCSGNDPWQIARVADIPVPGTRIETGWPICSVMSAGPDHDAAQVSLNQEVAQVESALRYAYKATAK